MERAVISALDEIDEIKATLLKMFDMAPPQVVGRGRARLRYAYARAEGAQRALTEVLIGVDKTGEAWDAQPA